MTLGKIQTIETFGAVDGPGIRYVIFLHGCAMRCRYCHNPETWCNDKFTPQTSEELIKKALKYKPYWKKDGGITVSGGEPLLQIDFLIELFTLAKKYNINTCIDTCGQPFSNNKDYLEKLDKLLDLTDLFILDIKEMNNETHKWLTSKSNDNILEFARYLSDHNKKMWIRHVLVPTITDKEDDLIKLKEFVNSLKNVEKFEILPYHTLGVMKYKDLCLKYTLNYIKEPSKEEVSRAKELLGIK
ncbi:MAG: pyruvate formate-lyase-activating protein [Mollicutes bacterium]|nr:pyruvate formate-lyase-activating protein [Mollicutes bacterium]MDD7263717.1 pyruvate formate-lyase-activating protein [bacterium]MDY4979504.1 pyruvate formate-lyase-activating protein [Candidatus Onthovivens sp.]